MKQLCCYMLVSFFYLSASAQWNKANDSLVIHTVYADSLTETESYNINVYVGGCYRSERLDIKITKTHARLRYMLSLLGADSIIKRKEVKLKTAHFTVLKQLEDSLAMEMMRLYSRNGLIRTGGDCRDWTQFKITYKGITKEYSDWNCKVNMLDALLGIFAIKREDMFNLAAKSSKL